MTGTIGDMANTSSRALRLLSLLQNHRFWPGGELAERLGVSPRTLRRDVDRLRELGYPVAARPGLDGGYQLAPGAVLPPLVLDDEEAVALVVGLRLASQGALSQGAVSSGTVSSGTVSPGTVSPGTGAPGELASGTVSEAAVRALGKVTQVMPARLRRRAGAVAAMTESASWSAARSDRATAINPDVLATTALACRDTERIRFGYGAASGERTERHVEPHRLVALDRWWYVLAYDLNRSDWRIFRLDRVLGVPQPTGARFRPRALPAADAAEYVRASIAATPGTTRVEALIEAPAEVVRERIGHWAAIAPAGPGQCVATMTPPDSPDWALFALAIAGADFQVLSPPELTETVADWGARFTRAARSRAGA